MIGKAENYRQEAPGSLRQRAGQSSRPKAEEAQQIDKDLEAALEQTFPASDPVAIESTLVAGGRQQSEGR